MSSIIAANSQKKDIKKSYEHMAAPIHRETFCKTLFVFHEMNQFGAHSSAKVTIKAVHCGHRCLFICLLVRLQKVSHLSWSNSVERSNMVNVNHLFVCF